MVEVRGTPRRRAMRAAAVVITAVMLLVVPAVAWSATFRVRADGERWRPARREITKGDVIVWKNPTNRVHDVKAYGGNWRKYTVLDPGESTRRKFRSTGRFKYRCARHSGIVDGKCEGMCGVIVVQS